MPRTYSKIASRPEANPDLARRRFGQMGKNRRAMAAKLFDDLPTDLTIPAHIFNGRTDDQQSACSLQSVEVAMPHDRAARLLRLAIAHQMTLDRLRLGDR